MHISKIKAALLPMFVCLMGAPVAGKAAGAQPAAKISQQRSGDVIQIFAENLSDHTITITVEISNIKNAKTAGWPTKAVKQCLAGDRVMMTALIQDDNAPAATFTCTMTTSDDAAPQGTPPPAPDMAAMANAWRSDPNARPAAAATPPSQPAVAIATPPPPDPVDPGFGYLLPFEHATSHRVSQGYDGRSSHQGLYAIDFDMDVGTPVCAARDGMVIEVHGDRGVQDSDASIGNLVAIRHSDHTVALYAQLEGGSIKVVPGQTVKAGEIIGACGATGHSNGPHLHFEVDALKDCVGVTTKGIRNSIPVVFDIYGNRKVSLEIGITYTAQ